MQNCLFIILSLFVGFWPLLAQSQQAQPLWGDSTGNHVQQATITPYLVTGSPLAVIVFPGGSYFWLDDKGEGDEVGLWLQSQGINAFVVRYRVPGWWAWYTHYRLLFRGKRHPDMFDDGQQALRWLYARAAGLGIDTARVGMMGFSAGGHLVAMQAICGSRYRPAFVAPIYPVVTMRPPYVHKRSRRGLLGEYDKWRDRMRDSLSVECHISADCPPMFIVACDDDPVVDYHNALLLDSALTARSIPHLYLRYRKGGHGFGVSECKGSAECRPWKFRFLQWLTDMGFRS